MALDQSALLDLLAQLKLTDVTDRIRSATETLYQELIDAEAVSLIGAAPFERSAERTTQRNGTRPRTLTTTAGDLDLKIPKLRAGTFFPALLERRRRVDQALFAVVMEAYVHGVSTRKVDELVTALGADTGISTSEVSRICAGLDAQVATFRDRDLSPVEFPYVFLDATYCKTRVNHRIVSQAVVVAVGVAGDGRREVLGFDVGDTENEPFWTAFLRSLKTRGLTGVKLAMSDAHTGLKKAIGTVFRGAAWQRCWFILCAMCSPSSRSALTHWKPPLRRGFTGSVTDVGYARFYGADNETAAGCDDEESTHLSGCGPCGQVPDLGRVG